MKQTLTFENLVLFVYDEISDAREREELKQAIRNDNELYQMYNELAETREEIDGFNDSPSENVINRILNYSKALNVIEMSDHTTMGLVMN
jgi:hypothetical protein